MPPFEAIKRRDLIRALKQLGFDGPYWRSRDRLSRDFEEWHSS